jgi:hypothetical protein
VRGVKLNNRLLAAGLIFCIAALTFVGAAKGQTITPGVFGGANFDYHVSSYWSSTDSYANIPVDLLDINKTSHVEVRIGSVNTTNVETTSLYYYQNGTAYLLRGNVNLNTGLSYGDFVAIIGANLNAGEKIHPGGDDGITIKEAVTRTYESGNRATNHISTSVRNDTAGFTATRDQYFDKETGILVEEVTRTDMDSPASTTIVTWKIDSTNLEGWVIPEFPVLIAVPIFMIAVAFTVVAFRKKLFKVQVPSKL